MSHRCSGQTRMRSGINDDRHAASDHATNSITLSTDLVHIVEMLKIAYGRLWKLRTMCWIRKCEELTLHMSITYVQIHMQLIASRKHWNVIGQRHLSLR